MDGLKRQGIAQRADRESLTRDRPRKIPRKGQGKK